MPDLKQRSVIHLVKYQINFAAMLRWVRRSGPQLRIKYGLSLAIGKNSHIQTVGYLYGPRACRGFGPPEILRLAHDCTRS